MSIFEVCAVGALVLLSLPVLVSVVGIGVAGVSAALVRVLE